MRGRGFGLDLQMAKEGILLGWHFGARSLGELVRIANYIETSVYERGSLTRLPDGVGFRLSNAPLRLGAFDRAVLSVNGRAVRPEEVSVRAEGSSEFRRFSDLSPDRPLALLPGRRAEFRVQLRPPPSWGSRLLLRLELHNVAIPPPVWLEFRDRVGRGDAG